NANDAARPATKSAIRSALSFIDPPFDGSQKGRRRAVIPALCRQRLSRAHRKEAPAHPWISQGGVPRALARRPVTLATQDSARSASASAARLLARGETPARRRSGVSTSFRIESHE